MDIRAGVNLIPVLTGEEVGGIDHQDYPDGDRREEPEQGIGRGPRESARWQRPLPCDPERGLSEWAILSFSS